MKLFLKLTIILLLFALVIISQFFSDTAKEKLEKPSPFVISAKVVMAADLGLHNAASDIAWLSAIQYFGDWQDDNYAKLADYIKLANDLDPKFSYPYAFGALILPELGKTDEAIEIAKSGIDKADPNWQIPYYLAVTYFLEKKDYQNAALYFDIASRTKDAPDNIKAISASFNSAPDLRAQSIAIWSSIYESSNDEVVRERAKSYVIHYEILNILEKAASIYKEKNGVYPENIDALVDAKILTAHPIDPLGFKYSIDSDGRARISS